MTMQWAPFMLFQMLFTDPGISEMTLFGEQNWSEDRTAYTVTQSFTVLHFFLYIFHVYKFHLNSFGRLNMSNLIWDLIRTNWGGMTLFNFIACALNVNFHSYMNRLNIET